MSIQTVETSILSNQFEQLMFVQGVEEFVANITKIPNWKQLFNGMTFEEIAKEVVKLAHNESLAFTEAEVLEWFAFEQRKFANMPLELEENEVEETVGRTVAGCNTTRSRCGMCSLEIRASA